MPTWHSQVVFWLFSRKLAHVPRAVQPRQLRIPAGSAVYAETTEPQPNIATDPYTNQFTASLDVFTLAAVTFHYSTDTTLERSSWAMLPMADIYILTWRYTYLTIILYRAWMQEEPQSFPRLNSMTSFPHFYYVALTLFASDKIKKK